VESITVEAIRTLEDLVASEFPSSTGLLLFGSHASGCAVASSDVDACVLLPRVSQARQISPEVGGLHFDLHLYDSTALMHAMQKQRRNRVPHIATWLRDGTILKDEGGALHRARIVAMDILRSPPEPFDWIAHRASITNLMRHVREAKHEYAGISCLNALYRLTTNAILLRNGRWLRSPTDLVSELQDLDGESCTRLHETYRDAVLGVPEAFLRVVEGELAAVDEVIRGSDKRFVA
jgi:hypothetical protein